ncbi:amidase [Paenochrobactrum sp. BZR 588]|uniref:amidase n=1 Tax=unclassified Paenochrobactrum TaxID=2639760 RepID=UPI003851EBED
MVEQNITHKLEEILHKLEQRRDCERVFSRIYAETALAAANEADERHRNGQSLSPLDGRIISVKDLFDVKGEPTLAGSLIRKTSAPARKDAVIVERLRQAGAIIIGKTHMTEFAFTAVGFNPHYGVPENAIIKGAIPGGSSSGAAVSVAEGTSEIAIGSDTGGSIRIPAALNGLVGFKPTASWIPHEGVFPLAPTLDSIGPLTKNVTDCIITDAIMADDAPPLSQAHSLKNLRVAVPDGHLLALTEPDILARFHNVLDLLKQHGAHIISFNIDDLIDDMAHITRIGSIAGIEASHVHRDWLQDDNAPVGQDLARTLRKRSLISNETYQQQLFERQQLARLMDARLSNYDLMVTPTCPIFAAPIADLIHNRDEYNRVEALLLRNNQIANQFDLCAITLPMIKAPKPAGFMAFARNGHDHKLLAISMTLEQIFEEL